MKVGGAAPLAPLPGRLVERSAGEAGLAFDAARAASGPGASTRVGPSGPLGSLEALLTLQETASPLERRHRAVRRAGRILDALDDLRVAALDPQGLDGAALERLAAAVREARDGVEDPGLVGVLEEIETRAAVELAKRESRRVA